jgi:Na+/H+-dicarboxylate symporter
MGLLLVIDAIVDMARTAVNATGTTVASLLVGVWEQEFDREAFNDDSQEEAEISAA